MALNNFAQPYNYPYNWNPPQSSIGQMGGQASQDVQTAAIQAGQRGLANEIEQYVLPTPRPPTPSITIRREASIEVERIA